MLANRNRQFAPILQVKFKTPHIDKVHRVCSRVTGITTGHSKLKQKLRASAKEVSRQREPWLESYFASLPSPTTMPEDPRYASPSATTAASPDTSVVPAPASISPHPLAGLAPLVEDLAKAVTCPICLDYMEDAKQLQCSHLFCATCVVGMLGMENVRCAVCKEKTGKRMVRSAPVRCDEIVKYLRVLEDILVECNIRPKENALVNDGYGSLPNPALVQMQNAVIQRQAASATPMQLPKGNCQPVAPTHKRCYLCPKGVDSVSFGCKVAFGAILPAASEKKRSLFVHERCAMFSEDVHEENGRFQNVQKLVARTNKIVCGRDACGRTRANINCGAQGCHARYHFPCAVVEKCVLVEDGFKMFCPLHKDIAPKIDEGDFKKTLSDPTDSAAKEHDDCCYLCQRGGRLIMCDTCDRVSHPVCSGLTSIPTGDWSCGVCDSAAHIVERSRKNRSSEKPTLKRRKSSIRCVEPFDDDNDDSPAYTPSTSRKNKRARNSVDGGRRYVLAHTGLHVLEKESLKGTAKAMKTMIRSDVDRRVTHLVIRPLTNEETPIRTMKLCKAIAAKIPIVCWKWVEESAGTEAWAPVDEHLHPLTWPKDEPAAFEGLYFYFGAYNGPKEKKDDLASLVGLGGGLLLSREPSVDSLVDEKILYVRDEDGPQCGRTDSSRHDVSSRGTTVSASWILDRCTKNRTS